eukprot:TRINITY_DN21430_c0_g1_i1.p1 TRINITY_DN21430_c0_g1~~TRINITY_DN21430_c0_g1_i1.p1  ORF type:complete len:105 (+),score=5.84 TRINITY_DN21430_c0_g1_i1:47-316(+)
MCIRDRVLPAPLCPSRINTCPLYISSVKSLTATLPSSNFLVILCTLKQSPEFLCDFRSWLTSSNKTSCSSGVRNPMYSCLLYTSPSPRD